MAAIYLKPMDDAIESSGLFGRVERGFDFMDYRFTFQASQGLSTYSPIPLMNILSTCLFLIKEHFFNILILNISR